MTNRQPATEFERFLPRLVAAYDRGLLVPFIGAGMSLDTCPTWSALVASLTATADCEPGELVDGADSKSTTEVPPTGTDDVQAAQLLQRANRAIRTLTRRNDTALSEALHDVLYAKGTQPIPDQTRALAKLWWPLVLTTNYDDLFTQAYVEARAEDGGPEHQSFADKYGAQLLTILGREPQDCRRVLSSLDSTGRSILWALHGYMPRRTSQRMKTELATVEASSLLSNQLVIGHEEYRRIAHGSNQYRRAFGEVYRRRSLLFVGAGLRDVYLLDLFAEVQELYGPGPHPHFALVLKGDTDAEFLRTRFNINVIEFEKYDDIVGYFDRIAACVDEGDHRASAWSFRSGMDVESLRIVHAPLPDSGYGGSEAVVVSAGYIGNQPHVSSTLNGFLEGAHRGFAEAVETQRLRNEDGVWVHEDAQNPERGSCPIAAVIPWVDQGNRDLRLIGESATNAFKWASRNGFTHLRMPLLGAGRTRPFAARFSLAEMVRAWGRWRRGDRTAAEAALRLTIHVVDLPVVFELTSGRINVPELLASSDLRFWVEVPNGRGDVDREPVFYADDTEILEIASAFRLSPTEWRFEVEPEPISQSSLTTNIAGEPTRTLRDVGVLPGATLRLVRVEGVASKS